MTLFVICKTFISINFLDTIQFRIYFLLELLTGSMWLLELEVRTGNRTEICRKGDESYAGNSRLYDSDK